MVSLQWYVRVLIYCELTYLTICAQDAQDLDFERLARTVIERHTRAILREFALRLRNHPVFSLPGAVEVVEEGTRSGSPWNSRRLIAIVRIAGTQALHVHLCADETVVVTIEPCSGKISLRDTGDLGAAGRAPRFVALSEKVNESPTLLLGGLMRLRVNVCSTLCPLLMRIHAALDDYRVG
jgi:mediator of RNA polymerase II transcription subunit 14